MTDIANNTSTTGFIQLNGLVKGFVETNNDEDWFKTSYLIAGLTYTIDLEGAYTSQGTLSDPLIKGIYNSAGTLVSGVTIVDDVVSGTNKNSRATFTPTTNGNYFLSAGGYDTNTGTYRLTLSGPDGYTANTSTSGYVIPTNVANYYFSPPQGNIEVANQVDWIKADLLAGVTYTINLEGSPTAQGTLTDPYLRGIYNAQGVSLGYTDDDSGQSLNSQVTFTPTTNSTYYIAAGASGTGTGTYKVSVTTSDDFGSETSTTGQLTANSSGATGFLESAADGDWFKIDLLAGLSYTFNLEGADTSKGTLTNPAIGGIYDSTGTLIANTSDNNSGEGNNAQVVFTPTTTGTY
jgi:hypothetical protein